MVKVSPTTLLPRSEIAAALKLHVHEIDDLIGGIRWTKRSPQDDVASIKQIVTAVTRQGGDHIPNPTQALQALEGAALNRIARNELIEVERIGLRRFGKLGTIGVIAAVTVPAAILGISLLKNTAFSGSGNGRGDGFVEGPTNSWVPPEQQLPAPAAPGQGSPAPASQTPAGPVGASTSPLPKTDRPAVDATIAEILDIEHTHAQNPGGYQGNITWQMADAGGTQVPHVKMLDVSHYQRSIDWHAVRAAGIPMSYLKAIEGHVRTKDPNDEPWRGEHDDPTYAGHRAAADAAGVITGAYDYAHPGIDSNYEGFANGIEANAVDEARRFLMVAQVKEGDLAPMLDLEENSNDLSGEQIAEWVKVWHREVYAATGEKPVLYTGKWFWDKVGLSNVPGFNQWAMENFHLILSGYGPSDAAVPVELPDRRPAIPPGMDWTGFQYSERGDMRAQGIPDALVDWNYVRNPSAIILGH